MAAKPEPLADTTKPNFEQVKALLETFNCIDETVQDKLVTGVKCLTFLYSLTAEGRIENDIQK